MVREVDSKGMQNIDSVKRIVVDQISGARKLKPNPPTVLSFLEPD